MNTFNYNKLFEQVYEENRPKLRLKLKQGYNKQLVADISSDDSEEFHERLPNHLRQQNPRFNADYVYYAEIPVDFNSENEAETFDIILNFLKEKGVIEGNTKFAELLSFIMKWYHDPKYLEGDVQNILDCAYYEQGKEQEWKKVESDQAFWDKMTNEFDPDFTGAPYIDDTDISFMKKYFCDLRHLQFVVNFYYEIDSYVPGTPESWDGYDFGSYDPGNGPEFEGSSVVSFYIAEPGYGEPGTSDDQGNSDYCLYLGDKSAIQSLLDKDSMSALDELIKDTVEGFQLSYDEDHSNEDDRDIDDYDDDRW